MPVVVAPAPLPENNDVFSMLECGNVLDFDEDQTAAWQRAEGMSLFINNIHNYFILFSFIYLLF